jgi:hypothetical protein
MQNTWSPGNARLGRAPGSVPRSNVVVAVLIERRTGSPLALVLGGTLHLRSSEIQGAVQYLRHKAQCEEPRRRSRGECERRLWSSQRAVSARYGGLVEQVFGRARAAGPERTVTERSTAAAARAGAATACAIFRTLVSWGRPDFRRLFFASFQGRLAQILIRFIGHPNENNSCKSPRWG